ncbi:hypothetical protein A1F96_09918 [Pyrenophora tritici-repentis]|nr:hypothetical protein PtrCC142_009935 [Pyrenophora tritici-repentis]PZD23801.1 hypothetical protein A1F96_09918 [Pyrenophora tritici-repentis]
MSQPSTPFSGASAGPFLVSADHEQQLAQADFGELFGSGTSNQPSFSLNNSEALDEFDLNSYHLSIIPVDSANSSTVSTPNFSNYSFGQQSPEYATPDSYTPHAYPIELQRAYQAGAYQQASTSRPLPFRPHTNDVYHHPAHLPQGYGRRRSLSHGEADRIVAANSVANPTFVRLSAPRATSTVPEENRRSGRYSQHGRSTSQSPAPRGRPWKPTSVPYQITPLVDGMLSMPLGTPINEVEYQIRSPVHNYRTQDMSGPGHAVYPGGPTYRQMTRPEELARSRQIIEIGAMVVTNPSKLDPRLETQPSRTKILKSLDDIEEHLKEITDEEALRSCRLIRQALAKTVVQEDMVNMEEETLDDDMGAPSRVLEESGYDVYMLAFFQTPVVAEVAPEITTVAEGYNIIAKLPCIGCPYLYHDTSLGRDVGWSQRKDDNALLLNLSLPFDSTHLSINTAPLLTPSKILPRIYVNQVLQDVSKDDINKIIVSNQLDELGGAYFGASYQYSLHRVKDSQARVFQFNVMQLWTDLTTPPLTVVLDQPGQKMLEVVLLPRPLLSSGDPANSYEIVRAGLVPRSPESGAKTSKGSGKVSMWFLDWDDNGKKGTATHTVNSASSYFVQFLSSGMWALFIFVVAVIALFVVVCLFCIFACGWHDDDYEKAQYRKRKTGGGKGAWAGRDVETARRFMSPEELGLRGSGKVVGVGKSD